MHSVFQLKPLYPCRVIQDNINACESAIKLKILDKEGWYKEYTFTKILIALNIPLDSFPKKLIKSFENKRQMQLI